VPRDHQRGGASWLGSCAIRLLVRPAAAGRAHSGPAAAAGEWGQHRAPAKLQRGPPGWAGRSAGNRCTMRAKNTHIWPASPACALVLLLKAAVQLQETLCGAGAADHASCTPLLRASPPIGAGVLWWAPMPIRARKKQSGCKTPTTTHLGVLPAASRWTGAIWVGDMTAHPARCVRLGSQQVIKIMMPNIAPKTKLLRPP
jgi:hypothetical protein